MCWVIPPASPAITLAFRTKSNSDVFPWSTWPITVTIGGRGCNSSSASSSTTMLSSTSAPTNSTSKPNSSAIKVMVSESRRWLMDTMMPNVMHAEITSFTFRSIMVANSATVTNSVILMMLSSSCDWRLLSSKRCWMASRFWRRNLDDFDFFPPESRARVARISFWMSSWLTSFLGSFRRPRAGPAALPAAPALLTSTFFTRTRLRLPSSLALGVFLRSTGSSIFPTTVGPDSFSAFARTTSGSAGLAGAFGASLAAAAASGAAALASGAAGASGFSSALAALATFFFGFKASKSTFPTTFGPVPSSAGAASAGAGAGASSFAGTSFAAGAGASFSSFLAGAGLAAVERFTTGAASLLRNWLRSISGSSSSAFACARFLALASVMLSRS